jgi:hypothetical protein
MLVIMNISSLYSPSSSTISLFSYENPGVLKRYTTVVHLSDVPLLCVFTTPPKPCNEAYN